MNPRERVFDGVDTEPDLAVGAVALSLPPKRSRLVQLVRLDAEQAVVEAPDHHAVEQLNERGAACGSEAIACRGFLPGEPDGEHQDAEPERRPEEARVNGGRPPVRADRELQANWPRCPVST